MKKFMLYLSGYGLIYLFGTFQFQQVLYSLRPRLVDPAFIEAIIDYAPIVIALVMGFKLRGWIFWPIRYLRDRAEARATARELANRYQSAKRVMDLTRRRIR